MMADTKFDLPQAAGGATELRALATRPEPFGDLLAAISHEIRTPLTAVLGFCELMGREIFGPVGDPRYAAYLRHIADGSAALMKSAEDTLALSAIIVDGERARQPETFDIGPVMMGILAESATLAVSRSVTVASNGCARVTADPRTCRQALHNLLIEAIHTTPGSRVTLSARAEVSQVRIVFRTEHAPGRMPRAAPLGVSIARTLIEFGGG
ncbi:MAG: HAMP domain-containing histidine kinase, partial [Hyphomicrobiaceae bacterium]|nr:HAMP domain-containing histidine kinase [Hyphomicrobiaceae bacterium]